MYFSEKLKQRSNNLSFMKFLAALLVIFSHCYTLSGHRELNYFYEYSGYKIALGNVAVSMFMFFSGFYICKSIQKKNDGKEYFKARISRIFPQLIFVILITTFVVGFLCTSLDKISYLTNIDTYKYLLNCFLIPIRNLPGVFTHNAYNISINGALWTLTVEFICYVGVFVLFKLHLLQRKFINGLSIIGLIVFIVITNVPMLTILMEYYSAFLLFLMGMWYYLNCENIKIDVKYLVLAIFACVVMYIMQCGEWALVLFFPYIMIYLALGIKQCSNKMAKWGKYSYGIYLYGFMIQQTITYLHGGTMNPYINALEGMIVSILLAMMTYQLVEKRGK